MKNYIYSFFAFVILVSCGSDFTEPEDDKNTAPSVPSLLSPSNNEVCTDLSLVFNWSPSIDSEWDAVSYLFQVATDVNFTNVYHQETVKGTSNEITLTKNQGFYWRVKSMDEEEASGEFSSINSFYTEADGIENHVPFAAELIAPEQYSSFTAGTIRLEWSAMDLDNDTLIFDVYLGTSKDNLEKIAIDISDSFLEVVTISAENYFWKVDVKDSNGANSIGQVWSFVTM